MISHEGKSYLKPAALDLLALNRNIHFQTEIMNESQIYISTSLLTHLHMTGK